MRARGNLACLLWGWLILTAIAAPAEAFDHTHAEWDKWLKTFTTVDGPVTTVDYAAAKTDRKLLDSYLKQISTLGRAEFDGFSGPQKIAFLVNAYNALTVQLIVENYPVKSIKDIGGVFTSAWKKRFFRLFGEEQNLDGIEHGLLRREFKEPRIHFAIVCASQSCPQLRGEAWVAPRLEEQFESAAKTFLGDSSRNKLEPEKNVVYLSKIFDWFGKDFDKKYGSVLDYVAPRLAKTPADVKWIEKANVKYLPYDWSLNEARPRSSPGK